MKFADWENVEAIQRIIDVSTSRLDVVSKMGYSKNSNHVRRKLSELIVEFDLDISSFTNKQSRWDNLAEIVKNNYTMADVLRAVGLSDQGGNGITAKKHIKQMQLDTSHFCIEKGSRFISYKRDSGLTHETVFCEDSTVYRSTTKAWLIRFNLLDHTTCSMCKLTDWLNRPISIELDHINGINNDNRLKNLRFLCPNCHSQTDTHRGKNR